MIVLIDMLFWIAGVGLWVLLVVCSVGIGRASVALWVDSYLLSFAGVWVAVMMMLLAIIALSICIQSVTTGQVPEWMNTPVPGACR